MTAALWLTANGVLGLPLALVTLVVGREAIRAVSALVCGFRVFELQLGTGRPLVSWQIGPLDLGLRRLPLGGATIAASGSPKRFRLSRSLLAALPLALQLGWLASAGSIDGHTWLHLTTGAAPLDALAVANLALITLHGLIPIETRGGLRTDSRILLDLVFGPPHSSRMARAGYYARRARHAIERGHIDAARTSLEQGLVQLGRERLLVDCMERVDAGELDSVVDQGDCADALQILIAENEPRRHQERSQWTWLESIRQAALSGLPLSIALLFTLVLQADWLALRLHQHLVGASSAAAETGVDADCAHQLDRWSRWEPGLDFLLEDEPALQRDRFDQLARLERCRGQVSAALSHHARALAAAEANRDRAQAEASSHPLRWLASEVEVARLLRQGAEFEVDRRAFREALNRIGRAEDQLDVARLEITSWPHGAERKSAGEALDIEHAQLQQTREWVLTRMRTH